jgi:hypothetical protein
LLLIGGLAAFALPQALSPVAVHAQTTGGVTASGPTTPVTGTPIAFCGSVVGYTPATTTATGTLTLTNVNTNESFTLPAGTTFPSTLTLTPGTSVCVTGTLVSGGQLLNPTISTNSTTTTTNVCGTVTAYSPATLSAPGSITIGGQTLTLGLGTTFTGTPITTGSNLCIAGNVNGLGLINGGAVSANASAATGSNLVSICGPISSYTAPTATTAGSITFSNVGVTSTFSIPAGTNVTGNLTLATGTNVCLVGAADATGALTSATITPNNTATTLTCGTVSAYTPATTGALGALTIDGSTIILGLGTTFSGGTVTVGTNQCFTLSVNGLGQAVSGTISAGSTPLAAVLYTPQSGWLQAKQHAGMPV